MLAVLATPALAQRDGSRELSLERIFSTPEFAPDFFGPARWIDGGQGYTTLEASTTHRGFPDIVRYDTESGRREILVPARRLVPVGASTPLFIDDYHWSDDGQRLLIYTNSERVWRRNTRGDYWVLDLDDWDLRKLGGYAAPSTLMFAKFAPDGDRVGYVCHSDVHNVYVEEVETGEIVALTESDRPTLINGTFDWVYEEEFGLRDGFRWSPDGRSIAYWQIDAEAVKDFYLINNTDSLYPKITTIPYPKTGEDLPTARIGIVPSTGGETLWLDTPGDPSNTYLARMEWAASSDEVIVQHLNRLQNTNQVLLGDARTGSVRVVYTDRDEAWVDVVDDLRWMEDGERFTWVSERDGWRRVYVVSRDGSDVRLATPAPIDVVNVDLIDVEGGWLYYIASPEDATRRVLYRSRLDGSGEPERLTPAGQGGTHAYQVSPDGRWAIHTVSAFGVPPTIDLVRLPSHDVVRTLADNARLERTVDRLDRGDFEFFQVEVEDGVLLDGWLMKPPDFDASLRYPLLYFVYGEPAGTTVTDSWGGTRYLWHLMLTQQGYLVASVDNRGTPAPKGRHWRKQIYGAVGVLASEDQASANRIMREWSFVDDSRIGIWGWSGGGSMTLNMMFRFPGLYQAGLSVAPVPDQTLYDAIYQERYMGVPQDNAEGYRDGSPITFAQGLEGNLLIVHGTGDDNVHYQGTERLINRLIELNKPFTMMAYPNRSHGIYEGQGTTRHLYELLTRYLRENLPAGGR
jgi:dipeptidyl-peptidase-4